MNIRSISRNKSQQQRNSQLRRLHTLCTVSNNVPVILTLHLHLLVYILWVGPIYSGPSGPYFRGCLHLSILVLLFLPSSSVFLAHFILAGPMREYLGNHSYISSTFPILNGTCFFHSPCFGRRLTFQGSTLY